MVGDVDYYQKENRFFQNRYWDIMRYASTDKIDFLIAFVTKRCNCDCRHCLYFKKRRSNCADLKLSEWRRIAQNIGHIHNLVISGGEPFLREDLLEILMAFHEYCRVEVIDLPTNGFDPSLIKGKMADLCEVFPNTDLSLSVSLDGKSKVHDYLRNCPGIYVKARKTLEEAHSLKQRFPKLVVTAQSIICQENIEELPALAEEIWRSGTADFHYFEIVRGEIPEESLRKMEANRLRAILQEVFEIQCRYAFKLADRQSCFDWYANIADIGEIADLYEIQYQNYVSGQPWPFPCKAGRVIIVIESDGEVRACELRGSLGYLQEYSYSLSDLLKTSRTGKELVEIPKNNCFCTHVCFILNSMERTLLRRMHYHPKLGIKKWLEYRRKV